MERRIDVFFYGLFMDENALHGKGLRPAHPRRASVNGFSLRLGARATLIADAGGCVHGMLMSLTHEELDRLYTEPSVAAYRPEAVIAVLPEGASVAALCFNLPLVPAEVQSNSDYATRLQAVARKLGLPESYVSTIV
jgi:Gamma-glutamyl cyclotransferase, AIG2-like